MSGPIGKRSNWLRKYNERFAAVLDERWPGGVLGWSGALTSEKFDVPAGAALVWRGGAQSGSIALDAACSVTKIVRCEPRFTTPSPRANSHGACVRRMEGDRLVVRRDGTYLRFRAALGGPAYRVWPLNRPPVGRRANHPISLSNHRPSNPHPRRQAFSVTRTCTPTPT